MIKKENVIEALEALELAWINLSRNWDTDDEEVNALLESAYPFERCFNETTCLLSQWLSDVKQINEVCKASGWTVSVVREVLESIFKVIKELYRWDLDYIEDLSVKDNVLLIQAHFINVDNPTILVKYNPDSDHVEVLSDFPKDFLMI